MNNSLQNHNVPLAKMIYNVYLEEKATVKTDFKTQKDAALYYFSETMFPTVHIDIYKYGNVVLFKIMHQIRNIIENKSNYLRLKVERVNLSDNNFRYGNSHNG